MPSSRPRIVFGNSSICNACNYKKSVEKINFKKREEELIKILKANKVHGSKYDCVVPWSGGKDSSYIAYQLKFKYGANPLLVTFSPLIPSEVGVKNRKEMIKLGFDHMIVTPNEKVSSYLSKRFLIERGNPKVAWDAGINSIPIKTAMEKKIKLIFYAEHGESHYGGKILKKDSDKIRDENEIFEHQIGDDPNNWVDDHVSEKDIIPYCLPEKSDLKKSKLKSYYFAYFDKWDVNRNYEFIRKKINFSTHEKKRSPGTFTNYDSLDDHVDSIYYYFQYLKFGFGRCWRDASRHIQLKKLKKYDGELDERDLSKTIKFLNISRLDFFDYIEKHRNENIWIKSGNKFELKFNLKN